jgi:hypothetical protein
MSATAPKVTRKLQSAFHFRPGSWIFSAGVVASAVFVGIGASKLLAPHGIIILSLRRVDFFL